MTEPATAGVIVASAIAAGMSVVVLAIVLWMLAHAHRASPDRESHAPTETDVSFEQASEGFDDSAAPTSRTAPAADSS